MSSTVDSSAILVTGGTGLIGAQVARDLLELGHKPILFDFAPSQANIADIGKRVVVERGDVGDMTDLLTVVRRYDVKRIIHLAAVLTIQTVLKPARSIITNCVGTANVFQLGRLFDMKRVVYSSSAAVYGSRPMYESLLGRHKLTEADPPSPSDPYGNTKLLCEGYAAQAIREGQDIVGLRPVLTFGVASVAGAVSILNRALRDAALTGSGTVTHPWTPGLRINPMYVKDAADLFVKACLHEKKFKQNVYNLGTGEYLAMREMMDLAEKSLPNGGSIRFEGVPAKEGGGIEVPLFNYPDLDSTAIRTELDWTPAYGFEGGARECIQAHLGSR